MQFHFGSIKSWGGRANVACAEGVLFGGDTFVRVGRWNVDSYYSCNLHKYERGWGEEGVASRLNGRQ
jgi:hypothetical protein